MTSLIGKIFVLLILLTLAFLAWRHEEEPGDAIAPRQETDQALSCPGVALADRQSAMRLHKTSVHGDGEVVKVLPDDEKGARHQRFLLRVAPHLVVLVAHNIDLAPRIDGLAAGDRLSFCGEYIWNDKGGVLHWTHGASGKVGGWLRAGERVYR
ncbi:MAG: DUF3465 domain-containing protein [Desulfobulbaceae bacterium]|jgi:hypothetical protein|nr:DUF3465 domain-containing protein [Desulfobulbaceae bacterium]